MYNSIFFFYKEAIFLNLHVHLLFSSCLTPFRLVQGGLVNVSTVCFVQRKCLYAFAIFISTPDCCYSMCGVYTVP